jgi:hypothetical protein
VIFIPLTGVLQDYFEQNVFGHTNSIVIQLSLVGSMGNFALNVFSPFVQILVSITGLKLSVLIATVLSTTGLVLSSLSKQVGEGTCFLIESSANCLFSLDGHCRSGS